MLFKSFGVLLMVLAGGLHGCAGSTSTVESGSTAPRLLPLTEPIIAPPPVGEVAQTAENYRSRVRHRLSRRASEIHRLQSRISELSLAIQNEILLGESAASLRELAENYLEFHSEILAMRYSAMQELLFLAEYLGNASAVLRGRDESYLASSYEELAGEYVTEATRLAPLVESAQRQRTDAENYCARALKAIRHHRSPPD